MNKMIIMPAQQLCGESCKDMEHSSRRTSYANRKFHSQVSRTCCMFDYYIRATGTIFDLDKPVMENCLSEMPCTKQDTY